MTSRSGEPSSPPPPFACPPLHPPWPLPSSPSLTLPSSPSLTLPLITLPWPASPLPRHGDAPGTLRLPAVSTTHHDSKLGEMTISLSDGQLRGLDAWYAVEVMRADDDLPRQLHHTASLGGAQPLSLDAILGVTLEGESQSYSLHVASRNTTVGFDTWVDVDTGRLGVLSLAQLRDVPACRTYALNNLTVADSAFSFPDDGSGGLDVTLAPTPKKGGAPPAPYALPSSFLPSLLASLAPGLRHIANDQLGTALAESHAACAASSLIASPPPLPPYAPLPYKNAEYVWLLGGGFAVLSAAAALLVAARLLRSRPTKLSRLELNAPSTPTSLGAPHPLSSPHPLGDSPLAAHDRRHRPSDHRLSTDNDGAPDGAAAGPPATSDTYQRPRHCLLLQPPWRRSGARVAVPLLIVAVGALYQPYDQGAEMYATASLAGQPLAVPPLYFLSLIGTVHDFLGAKVALPSAALSSFPLPFSPYAPFRFLPLPSASLRFPLIPSSRPSSQAYLIGTIVALSCYWPFVRLGVLALCLLAPPCVLPPRRCERLLCVLDATAKWAMVDFVMLSLLIIAFQLDVAIPTPTADAPVPMLAMHVRVMALPWYPLLPVSIGLSLVLTHVALLLQRASTAAEDPSVAAADDRRRLTALPSGARIGALLCAVEARTARPLLTLLPLAARPPVLPRPPFAAPRRTPLPRA